jgi:NAD(P)H-flavin reductase
VLGLQLYIVLIVHSRDFWKWLLYPGTLFVLDKAIYMIRSKYNVRIIAAELLESESTSILKLALDVHADAARPFSYRPGQYVRLCCPQLSRFEWHPFTISSSPHEEFVTLHIKDCGDWTGGLHRRFFPIPESAGRLEGPALEPAGVTLLVDGPYGTASDSYDKYDSILLVGLGVGVTPCASILKSLQHTRRPYKVHFYWKCRDLSEFSWFKQLLHELEDHPDRFELNVYCSQKHFSAADVRRLVVESRILREPSLPAGWEVLYSDEHDNLPYYYHAETQTTQWEWPATAELVGSSGTLGASVSPLVATPVSRARSADLRSVLGLSLRPKAGRPVWHEILTAKAREIDSVANKKVEVGVFYCGPGAKELEVRMPSSTAERRSQHSVGC